MLRVVLPSRNGKHMPLYLSCSTQVRNVRDAIDVIGDATEWQLWGGDNTIARVVRNETIARFWISPVRNPPPADGHPTAWCNGVDCKSFRFADLPENDPYHVHVDLEILSEFGGIWSPKKLRQQLAVVNPRTMTVQTWDTRVIDGWHLMEGIFGHAE